MEQRDWLKIRKVVCKSPISNEIRASDSRVYHFPIAFGFIYEIWERASHASLYAWFMHLSPCFF